MGKKYALIAREYIVKRDAIVTAIGNHNGILTHKMATQDTCSHEAKVKMAGHEGLYECIRCHKFICVNS